MNHILSVAFCLGILHQVSAVHQCYSCEAHCSQNPEVTTCELVLPSERSYLCESRKNKTEGTIKKRCIPNNKAAIKECDELNLHGETSCYYCDREWCNSASESLTSALMRSVAVYLLLKCVQ